MIIAVLMTTFDSGRLFSPDEFGTTGVDMIFDNTSNPLVNCPKMPFWNFKKVGGLFVGSANDRSTSVMKICESSESKSPLAMALAIPNCANPTYVNCVEYSSWKLIPEPKLGSFVEAPACATKPWSTRPNNSPL